MGALCPLLCGGHLPVLALLQEREAVLNIQLLIREKQELLQDQRDQ